MGSSCKIIRATWERINQYLLLSMSVLVLSPTSTIWAQGVDLTQLSIEDLMGIKVTSVSKKIQTFSDSAAAIFVITNEDLRNSGATNITDALRMVPGLNVARIDANKWAVNCRSSNSRFADKLLVLIDGRSIYTPRFSGVYWEVQDLLLEDLDRIEIIRGPGATLWGANAVNGVINIITKIAADTQGGLVSVGGGNHEQAFAGARYGTALAKDTYGRLFAKAFNKDEFRYQGGGDAGDDWNMLHGGFRLDSALSTRGNFTVQGDIYHSDINQQEDLPSWAWAAPGGFSRFVSDNSTASGGNLLSRWQHTLSQRSELTLQAYYDRNEREELWEKDTQDSLDLDFQHRLAVGDQHDVVWGARYRFNRSDFSNTSWLTSTPETKNEDLYSVFLQDEVMLLPERLGMTLGTKLEHYDSSGFEIQPSARLRVTIDEIHTLWAAVSRAVRTPSQVEQAMTIKQKIFPSPDSFDPTSIFFNPLNPMPIVLTMKNDPNFESEKLIAYELGYRVMPKKNVSVDIALFYNDYDNLREYEPQAPIFKGTFIEQPYQIKNTISAHSYGGEMAFGWQATERIKLDLGYSYLDSDMDDGEQVGHEPKHQTSLRGTFKLRHDLDLNVWLRYVDNVSAVYLGSASGWHTIDEYTALDLRLAWRPTSTVELALVGQNLLENDHLEFAQENWTRPTEVARGVYGKITYTF